MSSAHIQIPNHAISVFDEKGELDHIIHTGFLQDDEDDDESETESDRNEELNDVGSEDYAEESRLLDHDSEDDEDETDKEEERVIALVQVGEDLFGQDDQRKELEELEKDQEETGVITVQPEELPITAETHETSHTFNEHNSSTSFLSSTLAKTVAKVISETVDVKKLDRARNNLRGNLNSKTLQEKYESQLAYV